MRVYYLNANIPGRTGEKAVAHVTYDAEDFAFNRGVLSPYSILMIDEVNPGNTALCQDLCNTLGQRDNARLGKYYVKDGQLYSRDGWTPRGRF